MGECITYFYNLKNIVSCLLSVGLLQRSSTLRLLRAAFLLLLPPSAFRIRTDKRSAAKQASDTQTRLTDRQRETGAGPIAHFVIVGPFAVFAGV